METPELLEIISRDEDSKHQFKANVTNETSLAQEMVAFSNTLGGQIFIGVANDGAVSGLTRKDMGRLSNLVSNAASNQIKPAVKYHRQSRWHDFMNRSKRIKTGTT